MALPPVRTGILGRANTCLRKEGKAAPLSFTPRGTFLNYTNECNAACPTCLEDANHKNYPPFEIKEIESVLEQAINLYPQNKLLHLWGGEPFLNFPFLIEIVKMADQLGFSPIEIATNGTWGAEECEPEKKLEILSSRIQKSKLLIQLSCNNSLNNQTIAKVQYPANIIYLAKKLFPSIQLRINCVELGDYTAQYSLAEELNKKFRPDLSIYFDDDLHKSFLSDTKEERNKIFLSTTLFPPSLSGRCTDSAINASFMLRVIPEIIPQVTTPLPQNISIGIDRQFYFNLQFTSPRILPMGSIKDFTLKEIINNINADPIAKSLMNFGFSEIYPILKEIFPHFDRWAEQFYAYEDIFQGLENDEPVLFSPSGNAANSLIACG